MSPNAARRKLRSALSALAEPLRVGNGHGSCENRWTLVHEDNVLRAITDDGAFRVIAADTTATVRAAIAAQRADGTELVRTFADLLTGTVLVRESMAPDNRLQAVLQADDQRSRMIADTHPDGSTRGLIQLPSGSRSFPLGPRGLLQIARTLHNGQLHQGVVQFPATSPTMSAAFMAYMQESEQVVTVVAVGSHIAGGEVVAAGGYMVQLLPEVEEGPLMVMTERLNDFADIVPLLARGVGSPKALLTEILYGMPFSVVGERTIAFGCNCSATRLTASLATLPKGDLESLLADKRVLEIECDFCRKEYRLSPEHLKGLLAQN